MADAAAHLPHRALTERVRRFQFDRFDPHGQEWQYYIQRFETELAIHKLMDGADAMPSRRNLLLSRKGPEVFKVVVDHFRHAMVNDETYDDLNTIAALRAGKRAMLNVTLNDYRIRMLYDSGAAFFRDWS